MKPELQRIAIARARGWEQTPRVYVWKDPGGRMHENWGGGLSCPDYLNDLQAIRDVCLWALDHLWDSDAAERFTQALELSSKTSTFTDWHCRFDPYDAAQLIIRADAANWSYAFLVASNLWVES